MKVRFVGGSLGGTDRYFPEHTGREVRVPVYEYPGSVTGYQAAGYTPVTLDIQFDTYQWGGTMEDGARLYYWVRPVCPKPITAEQLALIEIGRQAEELFLTLKKRNKGRK